VPTIFLGLLVGGLFGLLSGLVPAGRFIDFRERSPASTLAPAAVVEPAAAAPAPALVAPLPDRTAGAPAFALSDLFDESVSHRLIDYRGRPVILNFWASWCVPCKEEMPALQRAYQAHRDEGLVILGVNQTSVDDLAAARDFVKELALTFPNVRDDTGNTSERLYQVIGLPTSVFITPEGEIAHRQVGQMTDAQIDTFSQQLVRGETITP
jgi:thiol-disulfide isomerase/thioredoxin